MAGLSTSEYLKYANLQMAAEAFIRDEQSGEFAASGDPLAGALKKGNCHTSKIHTIPSRGASSQTGEYWTR